MPPLLHEDGQQHPTKAIRHEDTFGPIACSIKPLDPRKTDSPEESQSKATAKRNDSSSDGDTPILKSITFSKEEFQDMCGVTEGLRRSLQEKLQALNDEYQKHAATKADLVGAKQEVILHRKAHEATKLQLAQRTDDVNVLVNENQRNTLQLHAKAQVIEAMRGELGKQQLDLENGKSKLKQTNNELLSTSQKLHETGNALATTQKKLESADTALFAANEKLKANADKAKKDLIKARKEHETREAALIKEKAALEAKYKASRQEIKTKEVEWNELNKQLVKSLRESRGQDHRYTNKVPDEKLRENYGSLRFKIGQFIQKYVGQLPDALVADQRLESTWEALTPNATKFLMSGVLHASITEAYIWECLRRTVFAPESDYWGGDMGALFSQMLAMAQNAEAMVTNLSKVWGNLDVGNAIEDSMEIFDDARSLDTTLRTLKADFALNFSPANPATQILRRFGFHFDDAFMKNYFRNPGNAGVGPAAVVDLVISPALIKQGNNDGADYLTTNCCIKGEVVCNAAIFFPQGSPLINMPREHVGHPHAVQAVKEEDMSTGTYNEHHLSPYTSLGFKLEPTEHGKVALRPDNKLEIKVETSPEGTAPGRNSRVSLDATGYVEKSSPPEARGPGAKNTQKRKRQSDDSGDELGEDHVPRTPEAAALRNRISRYDFRR
ncbi:hypothetical protein SLS53_000796 [Cytospora paraplurivora]|uniref:Uncharacterized protein n=1 Tax=Cytospora paraplurivora TaxID=2898453 RepID=A0AAN9YNB7_9PEZI